MNIIEEPKDWKDLQDKVAIILKGCNYAVETPKTIKGVRGTVEIDVFAYKKELMTIICECKYWNTAIPQTIVHGFRTVVNDLGANLGIIVTKTGYQEGAYNTANFTNIQLLTWDEFENKYKQYYLNSFYKKMEKRRKQLHRFSNFLKFDYDEYFNKLSEELKREVWEKQQYYEIISLISSPMLVSEDFMYSFNISEDYLEKHILSVKERIGKSFNTYYSFFSTIETLVNEGIDYFVNVYNMDRAQLEL